MLTATVLWGLISACVNQPATVEEPVVKRAQRHMGTIVTLTAVGSTRVEAERAVAAGFAEVRRLESLLSTWIPTSELSRLNAEAGRQAVHVSPDTLAVLRRAVEIGRLTEGAFNIAIGPAVEAWGFEQAERIPTDAELEVLKSQTDLAQLMLDEHAGSAFLAKPGMRVEIGGIGKGFAADLVLEVMKNSGARAGVAALSGDIKTFGRLPGKSGFTVGIRHPREPGGLLASLELQDEAISTAGDYERYFERDGVRYHHILDPRTLKPARACQSVTILARDGVTADGLDTGIFVLGPERGMALIERLPGVEGVIVDRHGTMLVSSGLKGRLVMEPASR